MEVPSAVAAAALGLITWFVVRRRHRWQPMAHKVRERGQAIVELALIFPILMLLLLGIVGTGLLFLAAQEQAASTSTVARWAAANPDADADAFTDYATRVGPCVGASAVYGPSLVTVTLTCPSWAGELVPGLPTSIVTSATAFVP